MTNIMAREQNILFAIVYYEKGLSEMVNQKDMDKNMIMQEYGILTARPCNVRQGAFYMRVSLFKAKKTVKENYFSKMYGYSMANLNQTKKKQIILILNTIIISKEQCMKSLEVKKYLKENFSGKVIMTILQHMALEQYLKKTLVLILEPIMMIIRIQTGGKQPKDIFSFMKAKVHTSFLMAQNMLVICKEQ